MELSLSGGTGHNQHLVFLREERAKQAPENQTRVGQHVALLCASRVGEAVKESSGAFAISYHKRPIHERHPRIPVPFLAELDDLPVPLRSQPLQFGDRGDVAVVRLAQKPDLVKRAVKVNRIGVGRADCHTTAGGRIALQVIDEGAGVVDV
ncbi:MAG: hypothetical protein ACXVIU_13265, partial [Halobacteriota archaeon]